MTDQKPNCSTCSNATFTRGENWLNGGVLCKGEPILPDGVATIKIKGCLSHPDAREWLMRDVVKEMSGRRDRGIFNISLKEAISLIKGMKE